MAASIDTSVARIFAGAHRSSADSRGTDYAGGNPEQPLRNVTEHRTLATSGETADAGAILVYLPQTFATPEKLLPLALHHLLTLGEPA